MRVHDRGDQVSSLASQLVDPKVVEADARDIEGLALVSFLAKQTYSQWAGDTWRPPSAAREQQRWKERFTDPEGWVAKALDGLELAGAVSVMAARTDGGHGTKIPGVAHLGRMFVHPEHWGRGIGTALLLQGVAEMKQRGYRKAQLYTGARNVRSRRFYERHGWRLGDEPEGYHEGIPMVCYTAGL